MSKFFSKFQKVRDAGEHVSLHLRPDASAQGDADNTKAIKEFKDGNTGLPFNMEYSALSALIDVLKDPNAVDDRKLLVSAPPRLERGSQADMRSLLVGANSRKAFAVLQGRKAWEAIGKCDG